VHPPLPVTILYFPAAQAEHVPPFGPVNPRLQTQLLNAVEPLTDCELLGQSLQVLLAEAPTVVEYLLTPQFKQVLAVVAPVVVEYLPASQLVQFAAPANEYVPAPQLVQEAELVCDVKPENLPAPQLEQVSTVVAPTAAENLPAPQSMHAELPVMILYFPARHAVHAPPFGPVYPRLQRQLLERLLPLRDCEFPGQIVQVSTPVAPPTVE
jgi:hypothetical protein